MARFGSEFFDWYHKTLSFSKCKENHRRAIKIALLVKHYQKKNKERMKQLNNVKNFWGKHLKEDASLFPGDESFFPLLLNIAKKSSKILEIGVGRGRLIKILKANGVDAKFHGIDITDNVYRSGTIGIVGDTRSLPYLDNTFDFVYSLGTVEHFPETFQAILEHARVVRRGGYVLVTTPHLSVFTPFRYVTYFLRDRYQGSFEEIKGRNIRLSTMKKYFLDSKLQVKDLGVYGMYGIWRIIAKFNLQNSALVKLQKINLIGAYLYIIGVKNDESSLYKLKKI